MRLLFYYFIVIGYLAALVTPAAANKFTDAVANSLARTFSYENLLRHKVECAFVSFIVLYFILAILGTLKNKQKASAWLRCEAVRTTGPAVSRELFEARTCCSVGALNAFNECSLRR